MTDRETRDFLAAMVPGTDVVGVGFCYRITNLVPMIGRAAGAHGDAKLSVIYVWRDGTTDGVAQVAYRSDLFLRLLDGSAALATDLTTRKGV